jgi:CHASE2 domain-containing sensor protein/nitrogen-specific signal transduction histidine kinase
VTDHSQRAKRLRHEWLLTTAIALALLALLVFADIARPMGNVLYDHLMRLQGFRATQNIVIVSIDDRSLQELGGWPLQRKQYTKLLYRLSDSCCRPKAIGFDLLFLDSTSDDMDLARSMEHHQTVLPLAFKVREENPSALQVTHPVDPLANAAALGHINLSFDADGVIRGIQTHEQDWLHFSLALHAKEESKSAKSFSSHEYRRFRMVDPRIGFPMISLVDAIDSHISRTLLKDKYVLIGVTAPSLGDRYPTLYSGKNNASTPGVAILASVLNASLNNALIDEATPWTLFGLTLIPLLAMLQSLVLFQPRQALILAAAMMLGGVLMSYALLTHADYWVDPVPFVLIAVLVQPLWAWRRLEAIVDLVEDKAAYLQQFQSTKRASQTVAPSREVVLQYAKLLDHAVDSARAELDFLSAIVNEMPDAVLIFDAQDKLLLSNQRVSQLALPNLKTGDHLTEALHQLGIPPSEVAISKQEKNSPKAQALFQLTTLLGQRDFVLKTAIIDSQIGSNFRLLILMDITELRQSQTQRDRALQFLSHDMRTPIASIMSVTRKSTELANANEQRKKINHHAQALLHMMDDFILTISAEASQYNVQLESLDNVINDSLEQVTDLAEVKGIQINDESDVSSIFVTVNARLLIRALVNLLFNAIKFSPEQSTIRIQSLYHSATVTNTPQISIIISNTVKTSATTDDLTDDMPGFGLGLDFVDNVVHKHHGVITREIPKNGSATVCMTLPCEMMGQNT